MSTASPRAKGDRWLGLLVAATVCSLVAVLAALVARTAIPFSMDGVVTNVIERNRSPGTEFWSVELADGRRWFVDEEAARAVRPGVVHKEAWSRQIRVGGEVYTIGPSRQLVGPAIWASVTAVGTIALLQRHRRGVRPDGPPS